MNSIKHYEHFPCMKPWVGDEYRSPLHKRLLVIGESHYLPPGSTIHLDAACWYEKEQSSLNEQEVNWLSTSEIIKKHKENGFRVKAHGIYKKACVSINSCTFNYETSSKVIDHYAFYNFFQRPAETSGDSIKVKEIDRQVSSSVFLSVLEKLDPELIIFTSSLAGDAGRQLLSNSNIPFVVTPHPTCPWWNRSAIKYNGKGRDLIPIFLMKYEWMT
jgi:hypothetical protein